METNALDYAAELIQKEPARKFTDVDLAEDAKLRGAALIFAGSYGGPNSFMLDMRRAVRANRTFSLGMMRGVLNCYRAEYLAANPPAPTAVGDEESFQKLRAIFGQASLHLKFPKFRLRTPDGAGIMLALCGTNSSKPGTIAVTNGAAWDDRLYFGRILADGTLDRSHRCTDEVVDALKAFVADPVKVASEYGQLTGICCFCSAQLTDERSTAVGYGPICAKHWGLPWGASAKEVA